MIARCPGSTVVIGREDTKKRDKGKPPRVPAAGGIHPPWTIEESRLAAAADIPLNMQLPPTTAAVLSRPMPLIRLRMALEEAIVSLARSLWWVWSGTREGWRHLQSSWRHLEPMTNGHSKHNFQDTTIREVKKHNKNISTETGKPLRLDSKRNNPNIKSQISGTSTKTNPSAQRDSGWLGNRSDVGDGEGDQRTWGGRLGPSMIRRHTHRRHILFAYPSR